MGLSGPLILGTASTVQNSQCTIQGATSMAQASGTSLLLTLRIAFSSTFTGSKVIYTAARDTGSGNTGWKTVGSSQIPEATSPLPRTRPVSPATIVAESATITATYESGTGFTTAWILTNSSLDAARACYVAYFAPGNLLLLYPDNGDGANALQMSLSGNNSLENSQCRIDAAGSRATIAGGTLTLTLNLTMKPAFAGPNGIWTAMAGSDGQVSRWRVSGTWFRQ